MQCSFTNTTNVPLSMLARMFRLYAVTSTIWFDVSDSPLVAKDTSRFSAPTSSKHELLNWPISSLTFMYICSLVTLGPKSVLPTADSVMVGG